MVHSITSAEVPETLKPEFTASRAMRSALEIARRGRPVFPCRHAPDKAPLTMHGFKDASRDESRITGMWNSRKGASIGVPAGERSGFFVLDVDRLGALAELPGELPKTLTVRTPRGGLHLYFEYAEGVTNSSGSLPEGLDVRGEGGYVLVPPSPGYSGEVRAVIAEAPEWLLEMLRQSSGGSPSASRQNSITGGTDGPTIFDGVRHTTLTSIAGRVFTGDVGQLEADLQAVNEHRCEPPLAQVEITKMARWFIGKEPCGKRGDDPEVEEVLDHAGDFWYAELLRGGGRSKVRDVFRALEIRAARFGEITTVEEKRAVEWADSYREIAEAAGTSVASAHRAVMRLQARGAVRVSRAGKRRSERSTLLIIEPAQKCNKQSISSPIEPVDACYTSARPPRPDRLETPIYRWRGHVGNSKGGAQAALEAFGPQTPAEVAERLGVSRARDLVRRHLEPMAARRLIEDRGGTWAVCGDHRERAEELRREPFLTVSRRRERHLSQGRVLTEVVETATDASEVERAEMTRERHRRDRERFRERMEREAEVESVAFDQLPEATPVQLADARYRFEERRYRRKTYGHAVDERSEDTALGGTLYHEGLVVRRDTGEVVGEEHPRGCQCPPCAYRAMSDAEEGAA